ncbi:hypothetical protein ACNKHO_16155 [Shigella flexneri]
MPWRGGLFGLACLVLSGCHTSLAPHAAGSSSDGDEPRQQVTKLPVTDCDDIWALSGEATKMNPLYWLRRHGFCQPSSGGAALAPMPMRCRSKARSGAFKRGDLLSDAKITPTERTGRWWRAFECPQFKSAARIRPLYQIWRNDQTLRLWLPMSVALRKLQETSDAQLDALRLPRRQRLQAELDLTTRKLQNLTDIERQLSSREPGAVKTTVA